MFREKGGVKPPLQGGLRPLASRGSGSRAAPSLDSLFSLRFAAEFSEQFVKLRTAFQALQLRIVPRFLR
jgi:hypothetical protein